MLLWTNEQGSTLRSRSSQDQVEKRGANENLGQTADQSRAQVRGGDGEVLWGFWGRMGCSATGSRHISQSADMKHDDQGKTQAPVGEPWERPELKDNNIKNLSGRLKTRNKGENNTRRL